MNNMADIERRHEIDKRAAVAQAFIEGKIQGRTEAVMAHAKGEMLMIVLGMFGGCIVALFIFGFIGCR